MKTTILLYVGKLDGLAFPIMSDTESIKIHGQDIPEAQYDSISKRRKRFSYRMNNNHIEIKVKNKTGREIWVSSTKSAYNHVLHGHLNYRNDLYDKAITYVKSKILTEDFFRQMEPTNKGKYTWIKTSQLFKAVPTDNNNILEPPMHWPVKVKVKKETFTINILPDLLMRYRNTIQSKIVESDDDACVFWYHYVPNKWRIKVYEQHYHYLT